MRVGFRSPDDLTGSLVDRENDGAISRSATQSTRRGPRDEPAKAVNQPHIASDNDQVSFDIRCVAGALRDKTRDREIVHIILSPDQLPGEAVQFGQVAGHVIEVEIRTVDGRGGRDAALGIACRSRVGYRLVDPLDPELTHGLVVDRPPLETPGVLQIDSFRERRSLYRQQQQGETLPALHGGKTGHECLLCRNAPTKVRGPQAQERTSKQGHGSLGISTAIHTAGSVPRFSAQWVVALPSAKPSPGRSTTSGLPSWR